MLAGVIWMLGWCMVLLAALVWLPTRAVAAFGLVRHASQQNLLPAVASASAPRQWCSSLSRRSVPLRWNGPTIAMLYTIVPWIGVMALGYAFGVIVVIREPLHGSASCLRIGLAATALFLVSAA